MQEALHRQGLKGGGEIAIHHSPVDTSVLSSSFLLWLFFTSHSWNHNSYGVLVTYRRFRCWKRDTWRGFPCWAKQKAAKCKGCPRIGDALPAACLCSAPGIGASQGRTGVPSSSCWEEATAQADCGKGRLLASGGKGCVAACLQDPTSSCEVPGFSQVAVSSGTALLAFLAAGEEQQSPLWYLPFCKLLGNGDNREAWLGHPHTLHLAAGPWASASWEPWGFIGLGARGFVPMALTHSRHTCPWGSPRALSPWPHQPVR